MGYMIIFEVNFSKKLKNIEMGSTATSFSRSERLTGCHFRIVTILRRIEPNIQFLWFKLV